MKCFRIEWIDEDGYTDCAYINAFTEKQAREIAEIDFKLGAYSIELTGV
ncbi:hypothetical protein [Burkholderia gladioli]|nr:hypothetical protein [Burkholderia gladioli]